MSDKKRGTRGQRVEAISGFLLRTHAEDESEMPVVPSAKYVPLYEGRLVHQFDHAAKAYEERGRTRSKMGGFGHVNANTSFRITFRFLNRGPPYASCFLPSHGPNQRTYNVGFTSARWHAKRPFAGGSLR